LCALSSLATLKGAKMKTRLAKIERAEHDRLSSELDAAEVTLKTLVWQLFSEDQVRALDVLTLVGDEKARELPLDARQELYVRRRQQTNIEQLRQLLSGYEWAAAKLLELLAEGKKNETT
jgi:autonomous glycyl radical cofactor GrcA